MDDYGDDVDDDDGNGKGVAAVFAEKKITHIQLSQIKASRHVSQFKLPPA